MESKNLKNRDQILQVCFQSVKPNAILEGRVHFSRFPKEMFERLCRLEMRHLSETEISGYYSFLEERADPYTGENCLNVFRLLKEVSRELLLIRNDEPECRYGQLLRWRDLTRGLGEDLPVCAFLADKTETGGHIWEDFEWNTVLSHDNAQLKRIMQRGISDNHFHLFGSAPAFELCWLKLMNHPMDSGYGRQLRDIVEKRRIFDADDGEGEESLAILYRKAAALRFLLFYYLRTEDAEDKEAIGRFDSLREEIRPFLTNRKCQIGNYDRIVSYINGFRGMAEAEKEENRVDYALLSRTARSENHDFEGERALIYRMLLGCVNGHRIPEYLMNWFYAYLVIKAKYYRELVQVNDAIGYENFHRYSTRRIRFGFGSQDEKRLVKHAVLSSIRPGNVQSLELRVSPWDTVSQNREMILRYDSYIRQSGEGDMGDCWYYVFHFPKQADEDGIRKGMDANGRQQVGMLLACRYQSFRKRLWQMGNILIRFREQAQEQAARVLGIDACSMEIGCRPEVFGAVFRRLSDHVVGPPNVYEVKQWKITYHVGEEFLDLVDGLRAIEEAVLFLNMENGDRLGHAMALGVDPQSWYEQKKNTVTLPLQDYLDNVVWLYHKLLEQDISSCETLKSYLLQQFDEVFQQLYGQFLEEEFVNATAQRLHGGRPPEEDQYSARNTFSHFDIHTYYAAWKLRGDDPAPYRRGKAVYSRRYPFWVNAGLPDGDEIRARERVVTLYLYYHYSADVRREGAKTKVVVLPDFYVKGVQKVQRAMQQGIAARGISIESNPSSNLRISTMKSYEEHPISSFYNLGLTTSAEELRNCPQLHVSINTDDKGVFHTSLENEFACMARALEKVVDEDGEVRYPRQMVYDWIDRIREMGNQQSFMDYYAEDKRKPQASG